MHLGYLGLQGPYDLILRTMQKVVSLACIPAAHLAQLKGLIQQQSPVSAFSGMLCLFT